MKLFTNIQEQAKTYQPLIVIVLFSLLLSFAHAHLPLMTGFMGYFLIFLSMFKFFDLKGFVEGFSMYDIVTQKFQPYGYGYPFIELLLGLAYLIQLFPTLTNTVTLIVMSISAIGVIKSIKAGMNVKCACLGTVLKVPLSTVSLFENVGMALMALMQLVLH